MTCRNVILSSLLLLCIGPTSAQDKQPAPKANRPDPYRVVLAVSSNMAQQKISEAAADGYRVMSIIPTYALRPESARKGAKEDLSGSGITIVLKRSGLKRSFDYQLLVVRDSKDFNKSLNQFGAEGFRLVPATLQFSWAERKGIDTFLDPESYSNLQEHGSLVHVALMEKAPDESARYSYRQAASAKDIEKFAAQGYSPVAGTVLARAVVVEARNAPTTVEPVKVQRARLASFNLKADAYPALTVQSNDPTKATPTDTQKSEESNAAEPDVKLDVGVLSGKKLLLVNDGLSTFAWRPIVDVFTVSGAPDTPAFYRVLLRNDISSIEKAVNESGAQGFRLFPTIATAYKTKLQIHGKRVLGVIPALESQTSVELLRTMAVMYPGTSGHAYQYRILSPTGPADLLKSLNDADADGFQFVSLWRGLLMLERQQQRTGDSQ